MADRYELRIGPPVDRTGEIKPGAPVPVGAGPGARIICPGAEPVHCRIEVTGRGLEVFNQSKAGTFVNGRKVERSLLKDGDELKLGEIALKLAVATLGAPAGAEPPAAPSSIAGAPKPGDSGRHTQPPVQAMPAPGTSSTVRPPDGGLVFGAAPAHAGPAAMGAPAQPHLAETVASQPGQFAPKAPPPLTRRFDPAMLKAAAAQQLGGAGAAPGAAAPEPGKLLKAEENVKIVVKERDGTAMLAAPNPTVQIPLSRKAFFGGAAKADEKFQPAPEFVPETAGADAPARAPGKKPDHPSFQNETPEEAIVRAEVEAVGLEVEERLGGHAHVVVYRARRRDLGQEVVVRAAHAEPGDPGGRAARLLAEAKLEAKLHHAGIVQVHGVFKGKTFVAIVLESLHGITLHDEVVERGQLTASEAIVLGERAGRALAYMHENGVVHNDVAPRNVMLTQEGEIKLIGFAEAASAEGEHAADRRADVAGLGATLHYALTGELPKGGQVSGLIDEHMTKVISRAVRVHAEERWESMEAMLVALRDASKGLGGTNRFRKTSVLSALALAARVAEGEAKQTKQEPLGFQGRLPGREVILLLRDVETFKKTGWLEVKGPSAADGSMIAGAVHFRDGRFVRPAVKGRRSVAEALYEIALLPIADFSVVYGLLEKMHDEESAPVRETLDQVALKLK